MFESSLDRFDSHRSFEYFTENLEFISLLTELRICCNYLEIINEALNIYENDLANISPYSEKFEQLYSIYIFWENEKKLQKQLLPVFGMNFKRLIMSIFMARG
ncbi:MAG: hypothetical protein KatS3mg090_0486 [Patescibacteria group bacterium]|nr:MAG: hypothetical protein KatS3mg090_0486 [Patescibacteria group bacterium]